MQGPHGAPLTHAPVLQVLITYRGTSLIRKCTFLGSYSRTMPRALWWSSGRCVFL